MKRISKVVMFAGLLSLMTGCANCGWLYAPFGPGTLCTGGPCDSCGGCGACDVPACDSCAGPVVAAPVCDTCGTGCGGACAPSAPCGPLTWVFAVLNWGYCGDGCGEVWWGDFHGAPPECCEPCNRMGDYTGAGVPMAPSGGGGCSTCGPGPSIDYTFQTTPRVLADSTPPAPIRQAAKPIPTRRR